MSDNKQIKASGLRFARGLQMTVKTAVMFTIQHKSVERPIQQSFELLNNLLKEAGQFTLGFVDNQIMLNNLLTTDSSLIHLQTEFLKRGIAAVTFEPGLTVARYRKVVIILSASTKTIEDAGGILTFLENNEVEGARILPAAKNQKKDEDGDTIIETDSESYILSKQLADEQGPRDFLDSIEALMESGCFDPSARNQMLSEFASRQFDGSGYGVPIAIPNLVALKEGETVVSAPAGEGGGAVNPVAAAPNSTAASRGGAGQDTPVIAPGQQFTSGVDRNSVGAGDGSGMSVAAWRSAHGLRSSSSGTFMEMVEASVQRSLVEDRGDPQKSYTSLARILRNMGVDKLLTNFPAERREELNSLPPEQLAAEYIEDTALQMAGSKLKSAEGQSQKVLVEEEVLRVLARSLRATHMADRLAQKLAGFIRDFAVPQHMQDRIRDELQWSTLGTVKKYDRLMSLKHYSSIEFRRILDLAKELAKMRDTERIAALATHYFEFLDDAGQFDVTELSRVPELIRSIPLSHVGFATTTSERLGRTLSREDLSDFHHAQTATALTVLAQSLSSFENFQDVIAIGAFLERSLNRDPERHKRCCGNGLSRILPTAAIERVVELFLQQRESGWAKSATTLLRYSAPASIENVFNHLINERDARNRLGLIRLIGQLGHASIEVAYKYLKDDRWYVVRNICGVLSELKDPDLADHIVPALEHPDPRVQQAALKALIHSRTVRAAPVLAASLPKLAPNVVDEALNELIFLRHVKTVTGLEEFIRFSTDNVAGSKKAIQVLANIEDDEALQALARIAGNDALERGIRITALQALTANRSGEAICLIKELASTEGPLAEEAGIALKKAAAGK